MAYNPIRTGSTRSSSYDPVVQENPYDTTLTDRYRIQETKDIHTIDGVTVHQNSLARRAAPATLNSYDLARFRRRHEEVMFFRLSGTIFKTPSAGVGLWRGRVGVARGKSEKSGGVINRRLIALVQGGWPCLSIYRVAIPTN